MISNFKLTEIENESSQLEDTLSNTRMPTDNSDVGKMYVELLGKQLMRPCLQTQELKLVKEHGVSHYVIVTGDDCNLSERVVTKQNIDGTISLTTVKGEV